MLSAEAATEIPAEEKLANESLPEKALRRWYEGRLAARTVQFMQMAKDRQLLRRGARKMQDGTLGQPSDEESSANDSMSVRIGDEIHHHYEHKPVTTNPEPVQQKQETVQQKQETPLWQKAALAAALLGGGAGAGMLASQFFNKDAESKPAAVTDTDTDSDTQYILKFSD